MINIKLGNITDMKNTLSLMGQTALRGRDCFLVLRMTKKIEAEYNNFITAYRNILDDCCEHNEDGTLSTNSDGNFLVKKDKGAECQKEIDSLFDTTVEIDCAPLPLRIFDEMTLTPEQMSNIESLIDDAD